MYIGASNIPITAPRNRGLWNPLNIGSTLGLWLDAADSSTITLNGSDVSQWDDKSGNGNHVSQSTAANQPLFVTNGVEFAAFEFIRKDLQVNMLNSLGTMSCFVVMDVIDPSTVSLGFPRILSNYSTESGFINRRPDWYYRQSPASVLLTNTSNSGPQISVASAIGTTIVEHLQDSVLAGGTNIGRGFFNGTQLSTFVVTPDTSVTPLNFTISNFNDVNNDYIFREIIFVNALVSQSQREAVEGYLAWKWNLVSLLPAAHPYKTFAPMM